MIRLSSYLLFSLCLSISSVWGQTYDVVGLVVDGQRGEPLAGVEILTVFDGKRVGLSQSTGRFEIQVNNRRAQILFRRQGFKDLPVDLGELPNLIDVEISLEPAVQELTEQTVYTTHRGPDPSQAQSIEELELMQGMRMDLNDHLRQMHGVAGMNEFTGEISVHGSRTKDVTHYLGRSRIPSLRHLDFGFPGNQSVLNPRLLKSVTMADNQAKGPMNQGNASALVYDLRDGDPEAIRGDLVLGSVNRELNLSGYWGGRTFLTSIRYLDPNSLGALGRQFFTTPKEARLRQNGQSCSDAGVSCQALKNAFDFTTADVFFATFKRDSTGAYGRHSLVFLDDNYKVLEDRAPSLTQSLPQTLVSGFQGAWLYSYEAVLPTQNGDWEWGLSLLRRDYQDKYNDTLPPLNSDAATIAGKPDWYLRESPTELSYKLGDGSRLENQAIFSLQWSPTRPIFRSRSTFGVDMEYQRQTREYLNLSTLVNLNRPVTLTRDMSLANILWRFNWSLGKDRGLEASVGAAMGNDAPLEGDDGGLLMPSPLASVRYTQSLAKEHKAYGEIALRKSTSFESMGYNEFSAFNSSSAEAKLGGDGSFGPTFGGLRYAVSGYTRWYKDPALPEPQVFWNYAETRSSDFAYVDGVNGTLTWLPSHHLGWNVNASVIQGDYHLTTGEFLPWESNRSLDLTSNIRVLPRSDSMFSFIITYGVANGAPLYEYRGLWSGTPLLGRSTGSRTVYQNSNYPEVSRQRVDMRVNLDLKSKWRPLESMRFFFEADNIFADFDGTGASWLGGSNQRRRGWTRDTPNGDLQPVITRGLGLFIMFGLEGKLKL